MNSSNFVQKMKDHPVLFTIFTSVLCSILWEYIFSPLSNIAFDKLLSLGGSLIDNFSNFVYQTISNGFSENTSQILLTIIVAVLVGFLFYVKCKMWQEFKTFSTVTNAPSSHKQEIPCKNSAPNSTDLTSIQEYLKQLQRQQDSLSAALQNISAQLPDLSRDIKAIKLQEVNKFRQLCNASSVMTYVFILFLYFVLATSAYVNSSITKLTNNIEIVSPYITDFEYKHLKSSFHSMKNRNDYDLLNDSLREISIQHGIHLK